MEWISVKDKMPKLHNQVFVRLKTKEGKKYTTTAEYVPPKTILSEDFMHDDFMDCGEYDEKNDCYWTNSGWYEYQTVPDINWAISDEVTHWMPQPEPPEEIERKKDE